MRSTTGQEGTSSAPLRSQSSGPVGFPTQGEVVQFFFEALGVLPRKGDPDSVFDEVRKKSTQKALQRLAAEEGALSSNLAEMLKTLGYLVAGSIPDRTGLAIGEVFGDLFDIYRSSLKKDGTYLDKRGTTQWLLLTALAPRLPISIAKHGQAFNVRADGLSVPDEAFWFLPEKGADGWTWPLERVMRWAYREAGRSAQDFHSPSRGNTAQSQNWESAGNWLSGRTLPSWPALLRNFNQSFIALDAFPNDVGRSLSVSDRNGIRVALFLARAATFISKLILDDLGESTLSELCTRYRRISECVQEDVLKVSKAVEAIAARHTFTSEQLDEVWYDVANDYWQQSSHKAQILEAAIGSGQISRDEPQRIAALFGKLHACGICEPELFAAPRSIPEGFAPALARGLALQKGNALSPDGVEEYAATLQREGLSDCLKWLAPWQKSTFHYRQGSYTVAYPFIKDAFEKAQYCAGSYQYLLLNQYVELAAKNDKWRDFKRGVEWATYLGFEVRLLRQQEQTEETLRDVFEMMKRATWPC